MKKPLYLLTTLLLWITAHGQVESESYDFDTKIFYQFTYQYDSTSVDSRMRIPTVLSVGAEASQFQSLSKFIADSTRAANQPMNMTYYSYSRINPANFLITKTNETIHTYEPVTGMELSANSVLFHYQEDKAAMNWELHPDTAHLHEWVCQKATLDWGGREWTAWFVEDIPVFDGPYKFCGLPGLIVSIHDADNYFSFELVSIKADKHRSIPLREIRSDLVLHHTTKEKFYAMRKDRRDNMIEHAIAEGTPLTEQNKENIRAAIKADNNHIEVY